MTRSDRVCAAAFFGAAALGMIFDGTGLWRMALAAALMHEAGHLAAYALCVRGSPPVRFRVGGIALRGTERLSRRAELAVLAAGPAVNLLVAAACLFVASRRASYALYFFGAAQLVTGAYNLLPLGPLDGARMLRLLVPPRAHGVLALVTRALAVLFACALAILLARGALPASARAALALAAAYLLAQGLFAGGDLW